MSPAILEVVTVIDAVYCGLHVFLERHEFPRHVKLTGVDQVKKESNV